MLGDIYRVTFKQKMHNNEMENVLHFKSAKVTDSLQDMAETFDAFVTASWKNIQTTAVLYDRIKVTKVGSEDDTVYEMVPTQPAGGVDSAVHPHQIAVCFAIRSNTTSRRKNGRFFVGGVRAVQPDINDGKITLSERNTYATFATAMFDAFHPDILISGYNLGVWSRPRPATATKPAIDGLFTPVQLIRVDAFYRTQRRRVIGVGA